MTDQIFERVSVRNFLEKEVEDTKIEKLLRAAMASPSAGNQRPWEFYVVKDKEILSKLSDVSAYSGCTKLATVAIVTCYRKQGLLFPAYQEIDMSACCENILLEAVQQKLGAVWLGVAPIKDRMEAVSRILHIPDTLAPFSVIPIGYPLLHKPQEDRFEAERIHYI